MFECCVFWRETTEKRAKIYVTTFVSRLLKCIERISRDRMKLAALIFLLLFGLNGITGKKYHRLRCSVRNTVVLCFGCSLIKELLPLMKMFDITLRAIWRFRRSRNG